MRARSSTARAGLPIHGRLSTVRDEVDWEEIDSWEPEDDPDLALDEDLRWFDKDMGASIHEILDKADAAGDSQGGGRGEKKKERSQASVRLLYRLLMLILTPLQA